MLLLETLKLGLPTGLASLIRIAYILFPLLITLEIAAEFGWLEKVSEQLAGARRQLGFPLGSPPLGCWTYHRFYLQCRRYLGLGQEGQWSEHELTLLWIVLSLSHAIIEDTAIFAAWACRYRLFWQYG